MDKHTSGAIHLHDVGVHNGLREAIAEEGDLCSSTAGASVGHFDMICLQAIGGIYKRLTNLDLMEVTKQLSLHPCRREGKQAQGEEQHVDVSHNCK